MDLSFLHLTRRQSAPPVPDFKDTKPLVGPASCALPLGDAAGSSGFVAYRWLVDPKRQIVGFHFSWLPCAADARRDGAAHLNGLTRAVSDGFVDRATGWKMGKATLLFDVASDIAPAIDWHEIPPRRTILRWNAEDLTAESAELLKALRARGFNHMVSGDLADRQDLKDLMTHLDVGAADAGALNACRSYARHVVRPIATGVESWTTFDQCASHQVPALIDPWIAPPSRGAGRSGLQPEAILIVRLLQMVQRNEDVRVIEAALKHDATLTFKLLQHINSPSVGAGVEIQSLHHAVTMLGYSRLFRFLSTLLASADTKSTPPYLTKKAIVRGRFVELLGHALLGSGEADNLFLVGMFSLLDQLLGIPMAELLDHVQLADAVQRAILAQDGIYGSFLKLALACEEGGFEAEPLADALFMSASQVNAARLGAIAWSQEISRAEAMY